MNKGVMNLELTVDSIHIYRRIFIMRKIGCYDVGDYVMLVTDLARYNGDRIMMHLSLFFGWLNPSRS